MNPTLIESDAPAVRPPDAAWRFRRDRPQEETRQTWPWWLWPHLLSLDAPVVALAWQRWWAWSTGLALPPSREIILGLGVWSIYLADRLADSANDRMISGGAARHRFSRRFRRMLLPAVGGAVVALAILSLASLPGTEFRSGMGLLAVAGGYFWLVHCWPGRGWSAVLPKEAVVGGVFSAGTVFFVVCRAREIPLALWVHVGLFAAVCFLNCALITRWEGHERDLRERSSLLNAFPRFSAHLRAAGACLALAALAVSAATMTWTAIPIAASAALLAGLDWRAPKMSVDTSRVLADVVLLTPLLGLLWLPATR